MSEPRLAISFSGGRTSAVMTKMLMERYSNSHHISVVFANTGCEHPATLQFVKDCDDHFGFGTVWVEAIIGPEGVGPRATVVSFETASRNGEPFEAAIKKHGMFGPAYPNCTGRLKSEVMTSFWRDQMGWKSGTYKTAIGIRADEMDRCSSKAAEHGFVYPLCDWGITKDMVQAECRRWPFDLQLPGDHYGNCVWCWKKSFRKLMTLAKESPEVFDFPKRMESEYRFQDATEEQGRLFFRGNRTVQDIFDMADKAFVPYEDSKQMTFFDFDDFLDVGAGCGESCEIGADA